MSSPKLVLELLLMIAHLIRDDHGELRYRDFNSFLQVNRALYACLNRMLWKEAGEHEVSTQRVLTHLIKNNNLAGLEFFLELGADVEVRLPAFNSPALAGEVGQEYYFEPTPLIVAAAFDNVPLARLLLEKGAKVQYPGKYIFAIGSFGPMHAARSGAMVKLLLEHNADPDLMDPNERRPLHWYAIRDNIETMRAILQHGANANPSLGFEKPLHEAARRNLETVKLLVEHGANVKKRDCFENTPLHLAAKTGKIDVVKFLVERWPEGKEALNHDGEIPLFGLTFGQHLLSDPEKAEIIALLGGSYVYPETKKD
jgi:ankyrin repeat protein